MRIDRRTDGNELCFTDEYYEPILMVGSLVSDWGPLETPKSSKFPWKRTKAQTKQPFGFSRALNE